MIGFTLARILLPWLLVAALLGACTSERLFRREAYLFGTRIELLIHGAPTARADAAASAVLAEFERLHREWHAWEPSALTALNASLRARQTATVSTELAQLLSTSIEISRQSDGLFEPALGAFVAAWGFHADHFTPRRPEPTLIRQLLSGRPRITDLEIDGNLVRSRNPNVQLDLGGIAKGYALDRAAAILTRAGIDNALINIGGNILALGRRGDRAWRVGIQHPRGGEPMGSVELHSGEAIGTSGDSQRYFELDGRRFAHIIDPRTGEPGQGTMQVTVLVGSEHAADGGTGLWSDAASKPLFLASPERWKDVAAAMHITHVLRIDASSRIEMTSAMAARFRPAGNATMPP
ncbi:MAG TPA: FAD:protein FMN transferase [Rhodocyclaceae bacterium]|nr:FAD:protein FMN transferase [Rhodocyclaceae bacterium]